MYYPEDFGIFILILALWLCISRGLSSGRSTGAGSADPASADDACQSAAGEGTRTVTGIEKQHTPSTTSVRRVMYRKNSSKRRQAVKKTDNRSEANSRT
jgi:hypothetical protein